MPAFVRALLSRAGSYVNFAILVFCGAARAGSSPRRARAVAGGLTVKFALSGRVGPVGRSGMVAATSPITGESHV
jgi:hypothetical protein